MYIANNHVTEYNYMCCYGKLNVLILVPYLVIRSCLGGNINLFRIYSVAHISFHYFGKYPMPS